MKVNLIRYPGSKAKLYREIVRRFSPCMSGELFSANAEYREPFFGSGAVGLRVMQKLATSCRLWLNDIDPGIACLWQAVLNHPRELSSMVRDFRPTPEDFYRFKEEDGKNDGDPVGIGFRKLALHRMSFSGLGYMAGGPLGGKDQDGAYTVDCRWNRGQILQAVTDIHSLLGQFREVRITCGDFAPLLDGSAFVYLDPPYYVKGPELYRHSFGEACHIRLRNLLAVTSCDWLLSYDDAPRIRELYKGCSFRSLLVTYTTATSDEPQRPKNQEVLISR